MRGSGTQDVNNLLLFFFNHKNSLLIDDPNLKMKCRYLHLKYVILNLQDSMKNIEHFHTNETY